MNQAAERERQIPAAIDAACKEMASLHEVVQSLAQQLDSAMEPQPATGEKLSGGTVRATAVPLAVQIYNLADGAASARALMTDIIRRIHL